MKKSGNLLGNGNGDAEIYDEIANKIYDDGEEFKRMDNGMMLKNLRMVEMEIRFGITVKDLLMVMANMMKGRNL